MTHPSAYPATSLALLAVLGLVLALGGCDESKPAGYYLIVELDNAQGIRQYSVFNPYLHSLEECRSTANTGIQQILTSDPPVVPRDSKVTGWRCSLLPPERGG